MQGQVPYNIAGFCPIGGTIRTMSVPEIRFGTEGWRGIIADDFTVANVRLVTHALARHLKEAQPPGEGVLVAYDCRALSEVFAQAAAQVLGSYGFPVFLTPRPVSSPAAAHAVIKRGMQGAVMFTASHNPPIFHGIKFKPHYGGAALTDITQSIERQLAALLPDYERYTQPVSDSAEPHTLDPVPDYLEHVHQFIRVDELYEAPYRVVTDAMHGSGAGYLKSLLTRLGLEVHALREERNPYFGGVNPEPIPQNLQPLLHAVKHLKAHIGIAIDGDGDRVGAVDEHGNFVDSHRIFAITLRHMVERRGKTGAVVKTFSVSQMIDKLCAHYGLPLSVTPIGFKFIVEKMLAGGGLVGGGVLIRGPPRVRRQLAEPVPAGQDVLKVPVGVELGEHIVGRPLPVLAVLALVLLEGFAHVIKNHLRNADADRYPDVGLGVVCDLHGPAGDVAHVAEAGALADREGGPADG